ncbi:protein spire homolog 1-like isoform X2 [Vanacampus margaritifer]
MSTQPDIDDGLLTSPSIPRDFAAAFSASAGGDVNMDAAVTGEAAMEKMEVSLAEILALYSQPINEEQAWAVCYQCCRTLAARRPQRKGSKNSGGDGNSPRRIEGPGDVRIGRDGTVTLRFERTTDKYGSAATSLEVIDSLGVMIYKALDYGLKKNEERELSPPLERLIDMMTNAQEAESDDACPDEGYEATEEEEEEEEEEEDEEEQLAILTSGGTVSQIRSYRDLISLCSSHLPSPSDAPDHYQAVCRALYAESRELSTFLEKIKNAKENLRKMEGETIQQPVRDLDELQNADWARFWVQVMRDLRHGVKLKKVQERQYNPLPIEYQLTPYEMLMDDIRSKRYKLRKVMVNGDIPPRLKKSAHEVILEFIRSRPPLNPVSARRLKPTPPRPQSLHERLLEDIKTERKLRPVSPDMTRRTRLVIRPLITSYSFDSSGAGKSISTPHDLCHTLDTPDAPRKLAISTQSLVRGSANQLSQRKRLLRAPSLAELSPSSESDEETTKSSSSATTSMMDISPDSNKGKKSLPAFLPVSATPLPDKHQPSASLRRHTIEKEAPANGDPFVRPSRQSSKSLLMDNAGKEDFCFPEECLALTVEEVMHIRQVLVKAELEKFQQYKDVYNALKKGKLCFSCRVKRFSFFTWSYTCQFCKRPVCSQCSTKIRLPSKPYATLPIYTLGPSATAKDEAGASSASSEEGKQSFGSAQNRRSLRRSVYKLSKSSKDADDDTPPPPPGELDLPKELTEDWASMEVCVDCKKFITEIISSSKRTLCVASKRARLHRQSRSIYRSASASVDFRPSPPVTIHEA